MDRVTPDKVARASYLFLCSLLRYIAMNTITFWLSRKSLQNIIINQKYCHCYTDVFSNHNGMASLILGSTFIVHLVFRVTKASPYNTLCCSEYILWDFFSESQFSYLYFISPEDIVWNPGPINSIAKLPLTLTGLGYHAWCFMLVKTVWNYQHISQIFVIIGMQYTWREGAPASKGICLPNHICKRTVFENWFKQSFDTLESSFV